MCAMRKTCKAPVFGVGPENAKLMFVGEAPGAVEDELGLPFVGASGKLFDKILKHTKIERESVFITNIVKCRPPDNRTPEKIEVGNCSVYLLRQVIHVKPKVVVALGAEALAVLVSGKKLKIGEVRGLVLHSWPGMVVPTWHPAFALRSQNENVVREMERDIKKAKKLIEE